jgi:pimeloyl-ACP methyl ester carboxylesterase
VVLLVMGLGAQLIDWDDDFVSALVANGYRVIRFDNRDVGLSEKFLNAPTPGLLTMLRYKLGRSLRAPYLLDDMAADSIALLDNLGIKKAHVAGVSMGGMIAQIMTATYPERISSLTSIMSSTGAKHLPEGSYQIESLDRDEMSRDEIILETVKAMKAIYAKESILTDQQWYAFCARRYDRSHYDAGFGRQFWAILDSSDRVELLKTIKQPTLVIHGHLDPLIPFVHGEHTAETVPQSTFLGLEDMGHFMAEEHHARIISAMIINMKKAN